MFSVAWNAPLDVFIDKNEFFEGVGVEMLYLRKVHEFLGMEVLPTFMCDDIIKNPQIGLYLAISVHLAKVL